MTRLSRHKWRDRDRILSAVSAFLVNGVIGYALLTGLALVPIVREGPDESSLVLFDLKPALPEQEAKPLQPRPERREAGGSPQSDVRPAPDPFKTLAPVSITAPPPIIPLPTPLAPAEAGPVKSGDAAGLGGAGTGDGAGSGAGDGVGRGRRDGGSFSSARQTGGRFRNSDFPSTARGAGQLKIGVRYAIGPSGRVDTCEVTEGSGYPDVDAMTCRVIMERYRFRPARDPEGYPVTEVRNEDYRWRMR